MTRGNKKRISPVSPALLALALLAVLIGGAAAYLSYSRSLTNDFQQEEHPQIAVDSDSVTIPDPGYAVYVRAAVVANWKNGNNIVAAMPIEGTDYSVTMDNGWKKVGEYYYYTSMVDFSYNADFTVTPIVQRLSQSNNYQLSVTLAVQAIQAVGQTDGDPNANPTVPPQDAVYNAWGIKVNPTTKELIIDTP